MAKNIITSLNVRGLNNDEKRRRLFIWLRDNKANIVFLQETFCQKEYSKMENMGWDIKHTLTDSAHSRGVAIMFDTELNYKIRNIHRKNDGRVILINVSIEDRELTLCNIYAPNKPYLRNEFFKSLKLWIARYADNPDDIILGGDFNCTLNQNDRSNGKGDQDRSRNNLIKLLEGHNLIDTWYEKKSFVQYTYTDPDSGAKNRIDYIFISNNIRDKIRKCWIRTAPKKDKHKAVNISLRVTDNRRGPGYWKFNARFLESNQYNEIIRTVIRECKRNVNGFSATLNWEQMKIIAKEASIKFGVQRARYKREFLKNVQEKLDNIVKDEDIGINIDIDEKTKLEKMLNDHYEEKTQGSILRSKINWKEKGERSTKYFLGLEKSRQCNNVIKQLQDSNGNLVDTDSEIFGVGTQFYDTLYTSKKIPQEEIDEYLENTDFNHKLSDLQKTDCDLEITMDELDFVIKNLKTGKSPGTDGLTPEFYIHFWPELKDMYMDMIKESYILGELPYTLRKALLALLYKKGDETLLKNYRPISLTNYDYKILCFALSNRLQKVLKDIIHEDQKGYIKGRYIGANARLLVDHFERCENFKIILLLLDFEKAFDSIEWNFMISVLRKFNFGEGFIKWVKILYNKPMLAIKNNGWISKNIILGRG